MYTNSINSHILKKINPCQKSFLSSIMLFILKNIFFIIFIKNNYKNFVNIIFCFLVCLLKKNNLKFC